MVLGTAAVSEPELVVSLAASFPGRVAVGLDHRGGGAEVAVSGWERGGGISLASALERLADVPIAAVVITSIETDGALGGPDLAGLSLALTLTGHRVVASGGVRSAGDLIALGALGAPGRRLAGVIVGKALVDGLLTMQEAVSACATSA